MKQWLDIYPGNILKLTSDRNIYNFETTSVCKIYTVIPLRDLVNQ